MCTYVIQYLENIEVPQLYTQIRKPSTMKTASHVPNRKNIPFIEKKA